MTNSMIIGISIVSSSVPIITLMILIVAIDGLEPPNTASEAAVLPLH